MREGGQPVRSERRVQNANSPEWIGAVIAILSGGAVLWTGQALSSCRFADDQVDEHKVAEHEVADD